MRKLNIFIYNTAPPGGVERVSVNLANMLADYCQANIFSFYSVDGQPFYLLDERVRVTHLAVPFTPGLYHYVRHNALTLKALWKQMTFESDSINLGMRVNVNVLMALLKRAGVPGRFIGCEHMNYEDAPQTAQVIRRFTYPFLDDVVVLTEADQQTFKAKLGLATHVIPNRLTFQPAETARLDMKRLLAVGRFATQKGFDRMIDALAPIMWEFPDWTLDIYGKGELESDLRHLIMKHGLNTVRLNAPTREVEHEYLNSLIFLMPSRCEAFGMVSVEAQACGLPVVAFDVQHGPPLLVNSDTGFLVPDNDSLAFTQAIR